LILGASAVEMVAIGVANVEEQLKNGGFLRAM
jgi:hypothetical protein